MIYAPDGQVGIVSPCGGHFLEVPVRSLLKTLPRIAARVLHNTHVGRQSMKEKFELLATAYGAARVEEDFELWCQEAVAAETVPRYPITEYIKIVDGRLGPKFDDQKTDPKDPRIAEISSLSYELTGFLPSVRSVGNMLASFSLDDITGAIKEFVSTLEEKDFKSSMRTFFADGGGAAVIYARQRRKS